MPEAISLFLTAFYPFLTSFLVHSAPTNHFCFSSSLKNFLDASTHLYKRLCPSVGRLVRGDREWWKCIESSKYLRLLHHSVDSWLVHTPRITLHHSTWLMQYCIILNKLSRMWTHRCTPGVLVVLLLDITITLMRVIAELTMGWEWANSLIF